LWSLETPAPFTHYFVRPEFKMTHSTHRSPHHRFLVIGYGNELQGDDAIGPWVAKAVSEWHLPSVQCLTVQKLLPELVDYLVNVDYVIFVDARPGHCGLSVQINPIVISKEEFPLLSDSDPIAHVHHSPSSLLLLTEQIYGYHPQAWSLDVPAECFGLGDDLSEAAFHGCDRALQVIEHLFQTYQIPHHHTVVSSRTPSALTSTKTP
jgi:hydrogenase maturation protease